VLGSVNSILHERGLEEYYCTLCYAFFDFKRRQVLLANSGLPYPIRSRGDECKQIELPGMPLGSFAGATYDEISMDLAAGDLFVFCTDGIFEAFSPDGQEFGAERLIAVVSEQRTQSARRVVDAVFEAVSAFRQDGAQGDDMTVVAVRITA
jgi:sigma-B regulation protein RsbU (phosphoserine phosphatase)